MNVTIGPIPVTLSDGSQGTIPRQTITLAPPVTPPTAALWSTTFASPAMLGAPANEMQTFQGLTPLPWSAPALAIQCLGNPANHRHSIGKAPDGTPCLVMSVLAGSGSDQAALLIAPRAPLTVLHGAVELMLDPALDKVLKLDGVNNWTTLLEGKTGGTLPGSNWWGDRRIIAGIQRTSDGQFHYVMAVDNQANNPAIAKAVLYSSPINASQVPVQYGKWITAELQAKLSPSDGFARLVIDGKEALKFQGPTMGQDNQGFNRLMLPNLYGIYPQVRYVRKLSLLAA